MTGTTIVRPAQALLAAAAKFDRNSSTVYRRSIVLQTSEVEVRGRLGRTACVVEVSEARVRQVTGSSELIDAGK